MGCQRQGKGEPRVTFLSRQPWSALPQAWEQQYTDHLREDFRHCSRSVSHLKKDARTCKRHQILSKATSYISRALKFGA
jgi:hypothetical protein